ncbi:hypothetical protein NXS98_03785 [Fontisphaera persica]|uniref:PDZ domain-containing protein n=1 Tax=Fontisphaera persica TaxID=2974023 RepID=UPI0024BF955E|nr:hypothetical protein [Fontisphaera persica]WCJ60260.1 hypothetical protein NXS98_03785 [Fontisphaera persica]
MRHLWQFNGLALILALSLGAGVHARAASGTPDHARWEQAIINIESTRVVYDSMQPWVKRPRTFLKTGVVIAPREILTAAEDLQDRTLVRVQKGGRGQFYEADVAWVDYHANLAILTVKDEAFWKGLKPVPLLHGAPARDDLRVARWLNANLEIRRVEFSQFTVDDARLSPIPALYLEFDSEMTSIGGSAPVISGGKLAGITCQQVDNHVRALTATFIRDVLEARKKGHYRGLGFFPFYWQPTPNTASHRYLKLPGEPRGVAVIYVPELPAVEENLKPFDIILQVDGFDIDPQGRYQDPLYGQQILENLSLRGKFAGDVVRFTVWREGAIRVVNYRMPKFDYHLRMLPDHVFDQEPEYLIAGGLVMVPLNKPFLRSWGDDWKRRAPFRLVYYDNEFPTPDRPSLVVMSFVLPDAFNLGYHELRALAVEKINGQVVRNLREVKSALRSPQQGYHVIEFVRSDTVRRLVLDASQMDAANARILQRYGIPKAESLSAQ